MTWFEKLTGFRETTPGEVRRQLTVRGETLVSRVNGKSMVYGRLETPSLADLRERVRSGGAPGGRLSLREVVASVEDLHADAANAGSMFQVASQFNLLEMAGPDVTPEQGVGIYEHDRTQGPACAVAGGAGTIYRNYFASVNGRIGQCGDNQIDCLADLGRTLGNHANRLWAMQNGYAFATRTGLQEISARLRSAGERERDELRGQLRIGIQWNTQVTLGDCAHHVSQAYCAALPVGYSRHAADLWEAFARLVLEASYEATVCAAILDSQRQATNQLFLTLLGGGVFGNQAGWIVEAIERALSLYRDRNLDVAIVSYGRSQECVRKLVDRWPC